MARGEPVSVDCGRLQRDDAFGLGKAMLRTGFLIGLACFAITWHEGLRWYWMLVAGIGGYSFVLLASVTLFAIPLPRRRV